MPLPSVCPAARRRRRICIVACSLAFLSQVAPSVAGNLVFECVGLILDRTAPF